MCAIAGLLFKNGRRAPFPHSTGSALTEILDATLHRGPDSAGWALYRDPAPDGALRMRFFIDAAAPVEPQTDEIRAALTENRVRILSEETLGCTVQVTARTSCDILELTRALEGRLKPVSIGRRLDILKDVGQPRGLAPRYRIADFDGDHGIAHIRLATESGVRPDTAHPFWAYGFSDVATVHNGQITNYWIMRRRLEKRGMAFQTHNDTELIAVYLAYCMHQGATLEDALKTSLQELDGTFSYLVATENAIGYAKDKLAAKPMVKYEDDEMIAISSEEVGLNRLFPGRALETSEPAPNTCGLWTRGSAAA